MQVKIENKNYDFEPAFNPLRPSENGWKKQNSDSFKFITLDSRNIFVKRFDKDAKYISGYDFIISNLNQNLKNIPKMYDLVSRVENKQKVYYLFQEALNGDTLEDIINKSDFHFNPQKFAKQIFDALSCLTNKGFWFTDFVEKNIFIGKDGNYYLIDIDSIASNSITPLSDNHFLQTIGKKYIGAVGTYWYRDIQKMQYFFISKNIKGDTINYLMLIMFLGHLRYYIDNIDECDFNNVATVKEVPNYLLSINEKLTTTIFKFCFSNDSGLLNQKCLTEKLFTHYVDTVLFPQNETITINFQKRSIKYLSKNGTNSNSNYVSVQEELAKENQNNIDRINEIRNTKLATLYKEGVAAVNKGFLIVAQTKLDEINRFKITFTPAISKANLLSKKIDQAKKEEADRLKEVQRLARVKADLEKAEKEKVRKYNLTLEIEKLKDTKKNWFLGLFIQVIFLGCGLFYVNRKLNRKWLYPINSILFLIIDFNEYKLYEVFGNTDLLDVFVILNLIIGFIGLIDVVVTCVNNNKIINKEINILGSQL